MSGTIRVGSRESVLAVKQAEIVIGAVKEHNPDMEFELVPIKTTGDQMLDVRLDAIGGKGLFIKELEHALLNGSIDIAVHSYKDMPYEETGGLPIVALSERAAAFDVLVLPEGASCIDCSMPVGSSSLRRTIQFSKLYEGVKTEAIRGNILTRLQKLDNGEYSALILAQAGLNRLCLQSRIHRVFTAKEMIPSGSQGILAIQGRAGEDYSYLDGFHSRESEIVSRAERQYLKSLGSSCASPVAVYCEIHNNELLLMGMYVDGYGNVETGEMYGCVSEAEKIGEKLAKRLKARLENV